VDEQDRKGRGEDGVVGEADEVCGLIQPGSVRNGPGRPEGILPGFVRARPGLESHSPGGWALKSKARRPYQSLQAGLQFET
jgi:hypothetical protein